MRRCSLRHLIADGAVSEPGDVVLLAVSIYLLKQDVQRVVLGTAIRESGNS